MREPRVIVGLRHYKDDDALAVDVEVFDDNPEGRELSEMFLKADAGIASSKLVENVPVSAANSLTKSYDVGPLEEVKLELVPGYVLDPETELRWLIDNVDADEAFRILVTARQILHTHPGEFTPTEALHIAVVYERG